MNLDDLKKLGAFVPREIKTATVEWVRDGEAVSAAFSFRKPSAADANRVFREAKDYHESKGGKIDDADWQLVHIAQNVVDGSGALLIPYAILCEECDPALTTALFLKLAEVGQATNPKAKAKTKKKTTSGVK